MHSLCVFFMSQISKEKVKISKSVQIVVNCDLSKFARFSGNFLFSIFCRQLSADFLATLLYIDR